MNHEKFHGNRSTRFFPISGTQTHRRLEAESLHIISLTDSYGKENGREHCRRFAWLVFAQVVYN